MKFGKLLVNELIKLYRRTSVRVIFIILIVIVALFSLTNFSIYTLLEYDSDYFESRYFDPEIQPEIDAIRKRADEYGAVKGDWRYEYVADIANNEVMIHDNLGMIEEFERQISEGDYDPKYLDYLRESIDDMKSRNEDMRSNSEKYWEIIEANDFAGYIKMVLEDTNERAKESIKSIDSMISHVRDADLADYNAEEKEAAVRALERVKAAFGHTISFYDSAINNGMEGTVANTRLINAVSAGTNSLSSTLYYNFSLKDSFDDYANAYKDFAEDCDALYKESEKYLEVLAVADYAAQNGVTEMTTANSSRMAIQNVCTSITFSLLCIFSILAAVYCVATEFTRKTVNMLVIRPISRFSIVLSKYCACLILLFGTALVAMILSFLIVGLRNDPADYFQPYIYLSGDNAASVPFLLWFAWRFFVAMIDITFFMTIAFTLSMLIRHTVPAMVITYGVYAFSSVFTLVRMLIIYQLELGFLYKYLPLSYLGMRAEVFGDIPQLNGNYSLDVNSLINGMLGANVDISMYIGLAYALIACGIMFFLSYRSLKKRDIKS